MKLGMDIESHATLPSGESLAHDAISGHVVPFVGVAHEEGGPRDVHGTIYWSTFFSHNLGDLSVAGENERDVGVHFTTRIFVGGGFRDDPNGVRDVRLAAFDYDFMRRLLDRDLEAEAELVKIAEANPNRAVRYEVSLGGTS